MQDSETEPTARDPDGTEPAELDGTDPTELDGTDPTELDGTDPTELDGTEPSELDGSDPSEPGGMDPSDSDDDPTTGDDGEEPVPDPQPAALRRQQLAVGAVGALLVALAVVVSLVQQFPALPVPLVLLAGFLGGLGTAWLVAHSVFPGERESPGQ